MSQETILYTFRRCPYAIRARLALDAAGISYQHREVLLRDKPQAMLACSPKGTVPVLLNIGQVIDESLDIMLWALNKNDPCNLLMADFLDEAMALIKINDVEFKPHLDRYKYPNRFTDESTEASLIAATEILKTYEARLSQQRFLLSDRLSLADYAILPFIRQFHGVDKSFLTANNFSHISIWLDEFIQSERFLRIMEKKSVWVER